LNRFEGDSMVNRVVYYLNGRSPYPLHRLDHPTSGVLLFGKTRPAARSLAMQFAQRHLSKVYLAALLSGETKVIDIDICIFIYIYRERKREREREGEMYTYI